MRFPNKSKISKRNSKRWGQSRSKVTKVVVADYNKETVWSLSWSASKIDGDEIFS